MEDNSKNGEHRSTTHCDHVTMSPVSAAPAEAAWKETAWGILFPTHRLPPSWIQWDRGGDFTVCCTLLITLHSIGHPVSPNRILVLTSVWTARGRSLSLATGRPRSKGHRTFFGKNEIFKGNNDREVPLSCCVFQHSSNKVTVAQF